MIGNFCCNPRQIRSLRFAMIGVSRTARLQCSGVTTPISPGTHCLPPASTWDGRSGNVWNHGRVWSHAGPNLCSNSGLRWSNCGRRTPADLQHVVGLSLGSAENLSSTLPPEGLHLGLCDKSLHPTLGLERQDYWSEVTPILRKWQSVIDASCPYCCRVIRVNMARHLRASHTDCQCFWRCPVSSCPMWFSSELNGKDHLERIHSFTEGRGNSFYDCLRQFGLEWFGRRSFFDQ